MWLGTVLLLPLATTLPDAVRGLDAGALAAVLFLALVASALAFFTWAYALHAAPLGRTTSMLYLVPAVAIAVSWLWLGEVPPRDLRRRRGRDRGRNAGKRPAGPHRPRARAAARGSPTRRLRTRGSPMNLPDFVDDEPAPLR